jgi:hypothetical protein
MIDRELLDEVRRMRAAGTPPKAIARALGVRPAVIAPLVRRIAAETAEPTMGEAKLVGCWVSPGWSSDLSVKPHDGWDDVDLGPDGPAGIALVLVARAGRQDRVSVCGYLIDTFCLGVKNVIGPQQLRRRNVPEFVRTYFEVFPAPALPAPIELAQHLVLGSVAYAARLGFSPHPDFEAGRDHLGEPVERCPITFGREGQPLYIAGPHDDVVTVGKTLQAALSSDRASIAA